MRLEKHAMALLSFLATLVLTVVGTYVVKLDSKEKFVVFSVGASISLALGLIENKLREVRGEIRKTVTGELRERLQLYRLLDDIDDADLRTEVHILARGLSSGQIPPHIAAIRIPMLYETAQKTVYASNVSLTAEQLYQWDENPRFRSIVETSRRRQADGVKFTRTFVLTRSAVLETDGLLEPRSSRILKAQSDAGVRVRIIWQEHLDRDAIRPARRLDRNFTIFDDLEAVDTTTFQVIYRPPSEKLHEFLALKSEQLKYSDALDGYLRPDPKSQP